MKILIFLCDLQLFEIDIISCNFDSFIWISMKYTNIAESLYVFFFFVTYITIPHLNFSSINFPISREGILFVKTKLIPPTCIFSNNFPVN